MLAERFGAAVCNPANGEDPVAAGLRLSRGKGVDGVIITASTSSNDPVRQAARMSRTRGRIVLVGVTGLQLDRAVSTRRSSLFRCLFLRPGPLRPEL